MSISNEVRVKNEPICYSQSISKTKRAMKVKEEPKDIEMQTSKSHIEVKAEEKFSKTEEFINKISIAYLNEEPTQSTTSSDENNVKNTNKATTSKCQKNKQKPK